MSRVDVPYDYTSLKSTTSFDIMYYKNLVIVIMKCANISPFQGVIGKPKIKELASTQQTETMKGGGYFILKVILGFCSELYSTTNPIAPTSNKCDLTQITNMWIPFSGKKLSSVNTYAYLEKKDSKQYQKQKPTTYS